MNYKKTYTLEQLRNKILYYINYRPRSQKEVETKLSILQASEDQTNILMQELTEVSLINDNKLLPLFIREYLEIRKFSVDRTKMELSRKGFQREEISKYLNIYLDTEPYSETDNAYELLKQKFLFSHSEQKMFSFLIRRGFSFSIAKTALELFKEQYHES